MRFDHLSGTHTRVCIAALMGLLAAGRMLAAEPPASAPAAQIVEDMIAQACQLLGSHSRYVTS